MLTPVPYAKAIRSARHQCHRNSTWKQNEWRVPRGLINGVPALCATARTSRLLLCGIIQFLWASFLRKNRIKGYGSRAGKTHQSTKRAISRDTSHSELEMEPFRLLLEKCILLQRQKL